MGAAAVQFSGQVLHGESNPSKPVPSCGPGHVEISGTGRFAETVTTDPIEMRGASIFFKPEYMRVGRAYPFDFEGASLVAVKRHDGSIDFYHLP